MKKFNYDTFPGKDSDVKFNRGGVYTDDRNTFVSFWLDPFQDSPNGRKGFTEPRRMQISFKVHQDPDMTGMVDDFQVCVETFDGYSKIFDFGEVDPEQLFWIGDLLTKVAKHYGIDINQQREENRKLAEESVGSVTTNKQKDR